MANHLFSISAKKRLSVLALLLFFVPCGCSDSHYFDDDVADARAQKAWRQHGDYYALLEIVDAYIDPNQGWQKTSKADVLKYLGKPWADDPDEYPNAGPRFWVYSSYRRIPQGDYLYVEFDENDYVKEISWGSE